jgi:hypothetical protein
VIRLQLDHATIRSVGVVEALLLPQDIAEVEPGVCKLRCERQCVPECAFRLGGPPQHRQRIAEIAVHGWVVGLFADRLADQVRGLVVSLRLIREEPEVVKGVWISRSLREKLPIVRLGLGQVAGLMQAQCFLQDVVGQHRAIFAGNFGLPIE